MTQGRGDAPARGWQQLEGAGMAIGGLAIAGIAAPGGPWWAWIIALIAPDIGLLGYLVGRRVGALTYNMLHIYATPFLLMMIGVGAGSTVLIAGGALWLARVGLDRAFGLGLKLRGGYRENHLGQIGRE
ncbi:DUF4260 domain-containing protein [Paracoccus laeviglucosivorans]|uniref:DUF4260 family protein n=1 Tax=Paracoccus laeviglucosivorans TaxID=1197861 RepID=A0A521AG66_9RHOB|nr:DUF4260 domain-containing protein [Paracoccus laeviglucosivorans]SMO33804.1 protein of unknown function [Paracoccus laeviglucosivorans]